MEDRKTPRMRKYGERKTTRIMMATVRHVTSSSGIRQFQADGFLLDWVHKRLYVLRCKTHLHVTGFSLYTVSGLATSTSCGKPTLCCGLGNSRFLTKFLFCSCIGSLCLCIQCCHQNIQCPIFAVHTTAAQQLSLPRTVQQYCLCRYMLRLPVVSL
jgi:hypothetical protein